MDVREVLKLFSLAFDSTSIAVEVNYMAFKEVQLILSVAING